MNAKWVICVEQLGCGHVLDLKLIWADAIMQMGWTQNRESQRRKFRREGGGYVRLGR